MHFMQRSMISQFLVFFAPRQGGLLVSGKDPATPVLRFLAKRTANIDSFETFHDALVGYYDSVVRI